ncbi:MAG TPA: YIP1 family protein [Thermoanaerobaculia bacterium]|nr:YIP1 family protein [Thermoanaerobaculia bacterium]
MSASPEDLEAVDPAASPLARVAGVFGSPGPTFASIARRPGWVLPLAISTVLSIAATVAVLPRIDIDSAVREQIASRGITLPEERIDQMIALQKKLSGLIGYPSALLAPTLAALLVAAVFWISFRAFGSDVAFRQSFGVTSHAMLPSIGTSMLLIFFVTGVDLVNPSDLGDLTRSNLGLLVDRRANPVLHSLARSMDVFTLWVLALLVIGFAAAAKASRRKAAGLVVGVWALYVLGKAGWAAIFH